MVNSGSGSATFSNQGGQVTVDPAGLMTVGQTYVAAGGTISGPGYAVSTLRITAPTALILVGGGAALASNVPANTTVWVQGNNYYGSAALTVPGGTTNDGAIELQSIQSNYAETLSLAGAFTNEADGTIQVNNGTGGSRNINGNLTNLGAINVGPGITLVVNSGSGSATFSNQGGQVTVDPAGLMTVGQTYVAAGGTISGPGYAVSTLRITAPTALILVGGGAALASNVPANTTVWVQGNNYYGSAALTVPDGTTNDGTIELQSIQSNYAETLSLAGAFTNEADGTVQVNNGTGGSRNINGNLTNLGAINVGPGITLVVNSGSGSATFSNQGGRSRWTPPA